MTNDRSRADDREGYYLRLDRISKKFGDFVALREVSLDIRRGEFILFLGPSGCGKTTLLRIIAGLETQTGGLIYQAGKEISALPPPQRDFGIVFQSYALFPNLTVQDNIAYGLVSRSLKKSEIKQRVVELLVLIGLPNEARKYPSQLSGGQQQRVAVARAIATNPGLLLLDEPLSALDAQVRIHLRSELKKLQRRLGLTTIMVTHDQGEALTMADRIVVMNHGVIEQVGTPAEIYQNPTSRFVADFIGTMNFLPASVIGADRVRVGGVELSCSSNGAARNSPVTLAIRAEDILLGGGSPGANALSARIHELEFNGSFCRATLSAEGLGAEILTANFSIGDVRNHRIATGGVLPIELPPSLIRVFPGS